MLKLGLNGQRQLEKTQIWRYPLTVKKWLYNKKRKRRQVKWSYGFEADTKNGDIVERNKWTRLVRRVNPNVKEMATPEREEE